MMLGLNWMGEVVAPHATEKGEPPTLPVT